MNFIEYFSNLKTNKKIIDSHKLNIGQSSDGFNQMLIASDFYKNNNTIVVVLPNLFLAQKYYDSLSLIVSEEDVLFFPADELVTAEMISATGDFLFERIQTLYTLLEGNKKIVITNIHGAIKYEMNKEKWLDSFFKISIGDTFDIKALCNKLISLGYEATFTTVKTGEFSKRGSIVDIFPLGYSNPIRIDFFDDEVETIKLFNIENQRSISNTNDVLILPVTEFIYDDSELALAKKKIYSFMDINELSKIEEDIFKKDLFNLDEHKALDTLSKYFSFFEENLSTIFDFIDDARIYMVDPQKSKECYERLVLDLNDYCGRLGGYSFARLNLFKDINLIISKANILIEGLRSLDKVDFNVYAKDIVPYNANKKAIINDLRDFKDVKKLVISLTTEERINKMKEVLDDNRLILSPVKNFNNLEIGNIYYTTDTYPSIDLKSEDLYLINEHDLFDVDYQPKKAKYKSIYKNAIKISKYDELVIGDYVVHYDYGIGKYLGIKTLTMNGLERDFINVMYANNSALYIPLEKISNLMKYASRDVEGVIIHEIGGSAWARTKAKARKRIHDISDKLIALYAERQKAKGFIFPSDSEEQKLFEDDFEYELTLDQMKAVDAVKADMESDKPMDRLICGDVGYGKTEVAMRAAFKAVYGGKQVCVLAPTTILARQHYYTFKSRMEDYGIKVEMLSRFVPSKKQEEVIEGLFFGGVDIVIGTHRVLGKDITFKDLGLLIIDEEQRFGVTHKEKIKELKVNVDCITLTATPIPRTLQMSVLGIKDLSMIETPPKNRYPIQTYVIERNDRLIADAIEREISRGGQVFYLYNWTETIEDQAAKLKALVPEANICIGHGRMTKDSLENVLTKFIDKKYNVLICTTIIETGIDIPDTNTLIIHDADRLGLSQLYQIRGRVGRSNKIAYAYLMYEPRKILTPEAEKRLATIKEFNELGSGFKIAMRDLSIRGAGDLLGDEQSGFVESIGLDMYLKILDEEINHKAINEVKKVDESLNSPMVNRTIKKSFIDNDDIRIEIHKRIDLLRSIADINELTLEITDRFGYVDDDLSLYMYERVMRAYCEKLGIYKIDKSNPNRLKFIFSVDSSNEMDGNKMFQLAYNDKSIILGYKDLEISVAFEKLELSKLELFIKICSYFEKIA